MVGHLIDKVNGSASLRDVIYVVLAALWCVFVVLLDISTDADIVESFLTPIALLLVYPVKRNWATFSIAAACLATVVLGALMEPAGTSVQAMLYNRAITVAVLVGIAFLLNRVTESERMLIRVATTDPLTGIFNRRHFTSVLSRELHRAERYKTMFSLLVIDIDHFKRINDTYGHPVGDQAIKAMVAAASTSLRPTDIIGRFGGEEFVVMLPHTDEQGAIVAAERIRESVQRASLSVAGIGEIRVTVSIGAAAYAKRATVDQLIECADQALYTAKHSGRNQVCVGRLVGPGSGKATTWAPA